MKYKTGFNQLDKKLDGFLTGEMVIVAARPGHSKIHLITSIARNIHKNAEKKPKIAIISNKQQDKFPLNKGDKNIFNVVYDQSDDLKSFFEQLYKVIDLSHPDVLIIDANNLYFNRNKEFYRRLKIITIENDILMIINSTLKRKVDQRMDKRPMISDLETATFVDETADKIILMLRPEVYGLRDCNGREQIGFTDLILFYNDKVFNQVYLNFDKENNVFNENIINRGYYH